MSQVELSALLHWRILERLGWLGKFGFTILFVVVVERFG